MKKILIIDDDADVIIAIRALLEWHHFEVFSAQNGQEGIELASQCQPNLVLCDLNMPKMDGYQVLASLKKDNRLADIPVIFLTGLSAPHQVRQGMILGADDYLTKPVDREDLIKTVLARISRREVELQRREQQMDQAVEVLVEMLAETSDEPGEANQNSAGVNKKVQAAWLRTKQRIAGTGLSSLGDSDQSKPDAFLVKSATEKRYVRISEIRRITSCGEYSQVFLEKNKCLLIRKSIKQWSQELPDRQYIQVHRKAIVNLAFLDRVEVLPDKNMNMHMQGMETPIRVSVRRAPWVNRKLKAYGDQSMR